MSFLDTVKGWFGIEPPKSEEELGHLRAIGEQPDDMQRRLAYASYLEGQQNPLGRYIRCEIEKLDLSPDDEQHRSLTAEADALIEKHGRRWVRALRELELEPKLMNYYVPSLWFERGMIESITVDRRAIVPGKIDRLLELAPALRKLAIARCSPNWSAIAGAPQMLRIQALDLSDVKLTINDLRVLAASPNLANLQELDVTNQLTGPEVGQVIGGAKHWKKLKSLKLYGCRIKAEGLQALLAGSNLSQFEELELGYNDLGDEGLAALVAAPQLSKLRRLVLNGNSLTEAAGDMLAGAPFRQLQELELESNELGATGVAALAGSTVCASLRKLNLGWNKAGDGAITAWAKSPNLANVRELNLSGNDISDAGLAVLANLPHLANIVELDISSNPFTDAGPLASSPHLKKLKALKLYSVELEDADQAKLRAAFGNDAVQM
jgi:uncharacterized protein (TIGR02996 family)